MNVPQPYAQLFAKRLQTKDRGFSFSSPKVYQKESKRLVVFSFWMSKGSWAKRSAKGCSKFPPQVNFKRGKCVFSQTWIYPKGQPISIYQTKPFYGPETSTFPLHKHRNHAKSPLVSDAKAPHQVSSIERSKFISDPFHFYVIWYEWDKSIMLLDMLLNF